MNAIDTLSYAKRLIAVGLPPEQAEAHALAMDQVLTQTASKADLDAHRVATKADFEAHRAATKADFEAHRAATKADLEAHRAATKADLDAHRAATKADLDALNARVDAVVKEQIALRVEMHKLKADIIQWMVSLFIAQIGSTIAAIRYLPH
ncbi:hypothetical protein [Duganella callida]|uniref:DUF1640 domain-containing protein n=1 Tax=Duganella callida TaxID=2561932 RepID=A0A4Y9SXZ1_9BURK|nr:hypothetical protein [Duganella callida]TFW30084.1 hypothetical protein E4L98_02745 [Duganella callida]